MSSLNVAIGLTLTFNDDSSRTYTIDNLDATKLENSRDIIKAINANANDAYDNFYKTFVSNEGEAFKAITAAKITVTEEDVIYNG